MQVTHLTFVLIQKVLSHGIVRYTSFKANTCINFTPKEKYALEKSQIHYYLKVAFEP